MSQRPTIAVLCGGPSAEREVSLVSGSAITKALEEHFRVFCYEMEDRKLPNALDAETMVVFPAMHGTFGEDGELQALLEGLGFSYAGCDPQSSALCMHKIDSKAVVANSGFALAPDLTFYADDAPSAKSLIEAVSEHIVLKPVDQGSSVGLHMVRGEAELAAALKKLTPGKWMAEAFITGREMTVGVLDGEAMGIVEIVPEGGVYDYKHKYTPGATEYRFPAKLPGGMTARCRRAAERAFSACGCRDFARVDFILTANYEPTFLEINTIPGLTPTSLLPKSASCVGLDFSQLARRMVEPAIARMANPQLT
mgnify:CR=1 FL=1